MTIASVRVCFYPMTRERELSLTAFYWGFSEWFVRRLKPIRGQLRGPEAKGVDIVNLMLHENPSRLYHRDQWAKSGKTFVFEYLCELRSLEETKSIENLALLLNFYAVLAEHSPWSQVRALAAPLAAPLNAEDRITLRPYLQRPRGSFISPSMARRMAKQGAA